MELRSFLTVLLRRKIVVIVSIAAAVLVAVGVSSWKTPTYTASAMLRVSTPPSGSLDYVTYDVPLADRLNNTYKEWILSPDAQSQLASKLGLTQPPKYEATIPVNTEFLQISVSDPDPARAAEAANALGEILISHVQSLATQDFKTVADTLASQMATAESELNQARADYAKSAATPGTDPNSLIAAETNVTAKQQAYDALSSRYDQISASAALRADSVSVASPASPPTNPSEPRPKLIIALGLVVGVVGGIGLALVFENLDSTLHTSEQIEDVTGLPVLGRIPTSRSRRGTFEFESDSPQADAFSRLRTRILTREHAPRTLVVTSGEPGAGKTSVALQLGAAFTYSEHKVIVVDCDLRKPAVNRYVGVPNVVGLTTVLTGRIPLDDAIQFTAVPGLSVLTSGPSVADPAQLLVSGRIGNIIEALRQRFTVVIFDTPPLSPFADAAELASRVDGVLFVVARGHARREVITTVLQELRDIGAPILGVVVNRAENDLSHRYYRRIQRRATFDTLDPATLDYSASRAGTFATNIGTATGARDPAVPLTQMSPIQNDVISPSGTNRDERNSPSPDGTSPNK
jgi:capsular exopolysaccharide synthesis family protein